MIKKTFVAAAVTAAVLGSGGAVLAGAQDTHTPLALAASSTSSSAAGATTTSTQPDPAQPSRHGASKGNRARRGTHRLGNALHGTWVTRKGAMKKGGTGTFVTHDAIRGTVNTVSATRSR